MFKEGDRIICINPMGPLKLDEQYIIKNTYYKFSSDFRMLSLRLQLYNQTSTYDSDRFALLKEQRKQKLKKICSKSETK